MTMRPEATIFVRGPDDEATASAVLLQSLQWKLGEGLLCSLQTQHATIYIDSNPYAHDPTTRDFLDWPWKLSYDGFDCTLPEDAATEVGALLRVFWRQGWGAVAACDFEEWLPNGGGYDQAGPWRDDVAWKPFEP